MIFMICYAASSWIPSGVVSVSSNVATENPRAIVRWLGLIFQRPTEDHRYGGFHSHGGSPIAGWMIYFMENPIYKWMTTRGSYVT